MWPVHRITIGWFVQMNKACHAQLAADASAAGLGRPLVLIGDGEANGTHASGD